MADTDPKETVGLPRVLALILIVYALGACASTADPAEPANPEPSMADIHVVSLVGDIQDISLAILLTDASSEDGLKLKEILIQIVEGKFESLIDFLPSVQNEKLVELACKAYRHALDDIWKNLEKDSCKKTKFCEKAYQLGNLCESEGY